MPYARDQILSNLAVIAEHIISTRALIGWAGDNRGEISGGEMGASVDRRKGRVEAARCLNTVLLLLSPLLSDSFSSRNFALWRPRALCQPPAVLSF